MSLYQKRYNVELTGVTDLLMHRDNVEFCGKLKRWQKDPSNKKISVAGDDRTPAWTWIGYVYHSSGKLVIDADNLMSMLRDGGRKCPAPTGKGSMKSQSQSGIMCDQIGWPLILNNGNDVPYAPIDALLQELDFDLHMEAAKKMGFELFVKRAKVGQSKHVRVRPRFGAGWKASGTLTVMDSQITKDMLINILNTGGRYAGLGDWRPGAPTPGQYGMFVPQVDEI